MHYHASVLTASEGEHVREEDYSYMCAFVRSRACMMKEPKKGVAQALMFLLTLLSDSLFDWLD